MGTGKKSHQEGLQEAQGNGFSDVRGVDKVVEHFQKQIPQCEM